MTAFPVGEPDPIDDVITATLEDFVLTLDRPLGELSSLQAIAMLAKLLGLPACPA